MKPDPVQELAAEALHAVKSGGTDFWALANACKGVPPGAPQGKCRNCGKPVSRREHDRRWIHVYPDCGIASRSCRTAVNEITDGSRAWLDWPPDRYRDMASPAR